MTSYVLRCSDPTCALETQNRGISYSCASCGGLLEVAYDFEGAAPGDWPRLWRSRLGSGSEPDRSGVWRFRELLPFLGREQTHVISLGEGGTPLVLAARSASWAGIDQLWVKHQGANPTGSFKDLGMTACISHGVSVGATCAAGRFAVLLGASGSGKTTLLRCIAGIEKITAGTIDIGGMAVADRHIHLAPERRELAMVFQDYALWPHMTVEQNVAFALHRHRLAPETARRQTRAMLERVGLDALGHRYPNELSGGEQQRVALARALVANTGLILFDEPLSNLDAHLRDRLRVEIATLVRECGATAIYITHDQAEAFALADDIGILSHGRLIQMGFPEEIYLNPATAFVARFTGLAGELAVHVHGPATGRNLRVKLGDRLVEARAPHPLHRGVSAQLLVRPSAGALVASSDDRADLLGVVRDVAFRGRGYEHVVALADGGRLPSLFSASKWSRGERVGVKVDPEQCLLLEHEPSVEPGHGGDGAPLAVVSTAAKVTPSPDNVLLEGVG